VSATGELGTAPDAIAALARDQKRPEIEHAPIIAWGHSTGCQFAQGLAFWKPDRVVAYIAFKPAGTVNLRLTAMCFGATAPHAERGLLSDGQQGTRWVSAPDSPDVTFFDSLLERLQRDLCIDPGLVFATGLSSGGAFTHPLSCLGGSKLRAGAPVAAPRGPPETCQRPMPMFITHGSADVKVDIAVGARWRDAWLKINGCAATSRPIAPAPCLQHDGCPLRARCCGAPIQATTRAFQRRWCRGSGIFSSGSAPRQARRPRCDARHDARPPQRGSKGSQRGTRR
jgi:predicted esterase